MSRRFRAWACLVGLFKRASEFSVSVSLYGVGDSVRKLNLDSPKKSVARTVLLPFLCSALSVKIE